jgi:hypothetical protein
MAICQATSNGHKHQHRRTQPFREQLAPFVGVFAEGEALAQEGLQAPQ